MGSWSATVNFPISLRLSMLPCLLLDPLQLFHFCESKYAFSTFVFNVDKLGFISSCGMSMLKGKKVVALYDYSPQGFDAQSVELQFKSGDEIELVEKDESGWAKGRIGEIYGYKLFLRNFLTAAFSAGFPGRMWSRL